MGDLDITLAVGAGLLLVAALASSVSARLGVPSLLLFLGIGMLAGSEGLGRIAFDDYELAQSIGIVALAYILFAGGLDTRWGELRPVLAHATALATVGVAVTALVTGVAAAWVLDLPLTTGLLLGAIISSTDAAAVFSVLRARRVDLRGEVKPLLELESGSNDPMAVFLTVAFLELVLDPGQSPITLVPVLVLQFALGAAFGIGAGHAAVWIVRRVRLDAAGLYPVLTFAMVPFVYGVTSLLRGSGFLAVYVAGLVMSRGDFVQKRTLMRFHDAIAWIAQVGMFLVLGLLVFPSDLPGVALQSLAVAAVLIFVARPAGVFLALAPTRVPRRDQTLVAWVGLRGAAPIILATFPLVEQVPGADIIFDTVFFVVLTSVLVQGTTISLAARRLGVTDRDDAPDTGDAEPDGAEPDGAGGVTTPGAPPPDDSEDVASGA